MVKWKTKFIIFFTKTVDIGREVVRRSWGWHHPNPIPLLANSTWLEAQHTHSQFCTWPSLPIMHRDVMTLPVFQHVLCSHRCTRCHKTPRDHHTCCSPTPAPPPCSTELGPASGTTPNQRMTSHLVYSNYHFLLRLTTLSPKSVLSLWL